MDHAEEYRIVKLESGAYSVRSNGVGETFHPVIGPAAEAEALYLRQLRLPERIAAHRGEFVIWDIGLGAAANVITVLRGAAHTPCQLRILSFDQTLEPLRFGLSHSAELGYFGGFEPALQALLSEHRVCARHEQASFEWTVRVADFPRLLAASESEGWPKPDAILYDAYSPAKNPAMWTGPLFGRLFQLLDPGRACTLPTYSRSTMLRVTLLLAGFYAGAGHATGKKEETTIAANKLELLEEPLTKDWLRRVRVSTSAEPLWEPFYRQAPLSSESWARLVAHPQWAATERLSASIPKA